MQRLGRPTEKPPNPFAPGKRLTRPDLFAGRTSQLNAGASLLVQAAAGNSRHALITGDRGIGKSSLAGQIEGLARGDDAYWASVGSAQGEGFDFLVAEYIAQKGETVAQVVTGLLGDIDRQQRGLRTKVRLDVEFDFKVVKANLQGVSRAKDATVEFVDALEKLSSKRTDRFGILLVLDEVDRIAESEGVPTFLKVATEMLASRGLDNICLLLIGTVGVTQLLKSEHASVPRIFEVIHVPLLTLEQSIEIIDRALRGTGVSATPKVKKAIAELAAGFPHPVHLIGSEAYEADIDGIIDDGDFSAALHSVISDKWREHFEESYLAAGAGKHRDIIKAMARCPSIDVSLGAICDYLEVGNADISANMNTLMKREVIVRVDRGIYRFKDPLFRLYLERMYEFSVDPVERRPRRRL